MDITSRNIYYYLIVETLSEFKGKEQACEVINRVIDKYKSQLTSDDWAKLCSTPENRCVISIRFARQDLIDVGILDKAKYGVWVLTKKGGNLLEFINRRFPYQSYLEKGKNLIHLAKLNLSL